MSTLTSPSAQPLSALNTIECLAKAYSESRAVLSERARILEEEVATIRNRKLPGIKSALAETSGIQAQLVSAIDAHPEVFQKPRTLVLHGVKVGFQKGKGKITWGNAGRLLKAIKRCFAADAAGLLIITKEVPSKKALGKLPVAELRRLGVAVEEVGDFVFVKPVDSDVDKLVAKILNEGSIEEADAS